jgi:hypothetical protein
MASTRWKVIELEKCRALGAERTGPMGRDLPDCDDAAHVALEVKSYKKFVFLTADWRQAKENAAKVGKPPVLAVKERSPGRRDIVQMRELDWFLLETLADDAVVISSDALRLLEHDNEPVVRMDWDYFVALYSAAFNNEED